jgi:hypothetical protein
MLWLCLILALGFFGSIEAGAPKWAQIGTGVAAGVVVLVAVVLISICLFTRPDLLRSEKFLIRRMEIEQGAIGDNLLGVIAKDAKPATAALLAKKPESGEA